MNVVSIRTGRAIDEQPASQRVLLITKHPFVPIHDGTSAIISLWYECLRGMGLEIDVLSFDYVAARWSGDGRAQLAREGVRLHLVAAYGERGAWLRRLGVAAYAMLFGRRFAPEWLRTNSAARDKLDHVLAAPYDLIVIHGVDAINLAGAERLRAHPAPKLLDIHDHVPLRIVAMQRSLLRMLRWRGLDARHHVARSDMLQAASWPALNRLTRAESRVAQICDRILCSAPSELDMLRTGGVAEERLVPIRWPVACTGRPEPKALRRHNFGFIGSGALFNVEGLLFFCRDIWPLIRAARPGATLLVAGRAGEACARLPERQRRGIVIAGWMDDVGSFYRSVDVVVVPLLSGTGVSVKTMEAAARGAAIVSTQAGLRGLALRDRIDVRRAETPAEFADAALSLLDDPEMAASLGASAAEAMAASHDPAMFRRTIEGLVDLVVNPMQKTRVSGLTA